MFKNLSLIIYNIIPLGLRNKLGQSPLLKPLRDLFLRSKDSYKEAKVFVEKRYLENVVQFVFFASIKVASKAKNKGIENTILRNSIKLIEDFKTKEGDAVVFDIGANFGYLSLVWANTISKNGQVLAFEPNLNVYNSFNKSIKANDLSFKIQLNNLAVGNKDGVIGLFLDSTTSNTLNDTVKPKMRTTIEMVSIDSFMEKHRFERCDLVKIDVDGIELDILMGAKKLISESKPIFIVETNGDERIVDFFDQFNYQILDMKLDPFHSRDRLPQNIFCIPKLT